MHFFPLTKWHHSSDRMGPLQNSHFCRRKRAHRCLVSVSCVTDSCKWSEWKMKDGRPRKWNQLFLFRKLKKKKGSPLDIGKWESELQIHTVPSDTNLDLARWKAHCPLIYRFLSCRSFQTTAVGLQLFTDTDLVNIYLLTAKEPGLFIHRGEKKWLTTRNTGLNNWLDTK